MVKTKKNKEGNLSSKVAHKETDVGRHGRRPHDPWTTSAPTGSLDRPRSRGGRSQVRGGGQTAENCREVTKSVDPKI